MRVRQKSWISLHSSGLLSAGGYKQEGFGARTMIDSFSSLPWHDAELQELSIDRRSPGVRDEVRLQVVWPDGVQAALLFRDCYGLTAEMNFGVIAKEQIASASLIDDDPGLISLRDRWKPLRVPLDTLHCYRLETSSTASVIRIYAKRFEILEAGDCTSVR